MNHPTDQAQVGRLAMRVEGENWNAYYAQPDTMVGALYLGSIRMAFVQDKQRKQAFMDLMRSAVSDMLEGIVEAKVEWMPSVTAPEKERSQQ